MVKKKLKKKLKRKSQKKQKKQQKEEKNELPEVDKELYEIQINDLNSKLKRLKEDHMALESENLKIKNDLVQQNEDQADVIAYLKQILKTKIEDTEQLQDRLTALQQAKEKENTEFSEKLTNKEDELNNVRDQLTTEIKLLNGKLNVLDEFRVQKEDLTQKFNIQEETQKQQELRHQETLHNIEKNFILKKIHMKKEVEERLIRLSEDFQTIMQSKIDSTTKITVAENNSLKSEMIKLMETCKELIKENNGLKENERLIKIRFSDLKGELEESIRKYISQTKKLQKILSETKELKCVSRVDSDFYTQKIQNLTESIEEYRRNLEKQISVNEKLEKNILLYQQKENVLNEKLRSALVRVENTENVIRNAVLAIKEILVVENEKTESKHLNRILFASSLLEILKNAKIEDHGVLITDPAWMSHTKPFVEQNK